MAKSLQDRIKSLAAFRPDISFKDGTFILKIKFKDGWSIIKPEDTERVAFAEDNSIKNMYWYVSNIEDADMIFDVIEETIKVNKELEKKIELYKIKVHELQELFLSDETYERLLTLEFTIPSVKSKPKKKQVKPKKTKDNEVEVKNGEPINEQKVETPTETVSDIDKKIAEALKK